MHSTARRIILISFISFSDHLRLMLYIIIFKTTICHIPLFPIYCISGDIEQKNNLHFLWSDMIIGYGLILEKQTRFPNINNDMPYKSWGEGMRSMQH